MRHIHENGAILGAAFPSSHVAASFIPWWHTWVRFPRHRWWMTLLFLMLCMSTVYCRYHYVVDVIAGLLLGILVVYAGRRLGDTARERFQTGIRLGTDQAPFFKRSPLESGIMLSDSSPGPAPRAFFPAPHPDRGVVPMRIRISWSLPFSPAPAPPPWPTASSPGGIQLGPRFRLRGCPLRNHQDPGLGLVEPVNPSFGDVGEHASARSLRVQADSGRGRDHPGCHLQLEPGMRMDINGGMSVADEPVAGGDERQDGAGHRGRASSAMRPVSPCPRSPRSPAPGVRSLDPDHRDQSRRASPGRLPSSTRMTRTTLWLPPPATRGQITVSIC